MKAKKRLDKDRKVLKRGESQRKDGIYDYRWTGKDGKRHSVYAGTLAELRMLEEQIERDKADGIKVDAMNTTLNDMYKIWCDVKRGLKDNTFQGYKYYYEAFVADDLGQMRLQAIKKTDVRRFYNKLVDERGMKFNSVDSVHTVVHQILNLAVEDCFIRINPSDNALKELKQSRNMDTEKRHALTVDQQKLFLTYLKTHRQYSHWYPIFAVMLGTGMRVGEATGLHWCDIDLEAGEIDVNHTLIYYAHRDKEHNCFFGINTPKTKAGERVIPMLDFVKDAIQQEKTNQELQNISCKAVVDGYTDFIFLNRFGNVQHQGTLNKAIRRISRDCNDEILERGEPDPVLLPRFSCHNLRHTFATRLCESGVNIKVIQETLGHKDISTTMDVYAEATKDLKRREFGNMELTNGDIWNI
ncbi:MAG: site-specific integrase [Lachnospiraceae bacterium]|nr:site-specific integrase [Lachnospiraceae bacterium]